MIDVPRGHTEGVRAYGEMLAEEIGIEGEELNRFRWGLLLHDIGKLAVPDEILNKSSELTDAEWETLRNHPSAGATMVEPLRPWLGEHVNAAGEHHEKWDGSGYPLGLAGTNISLIGRVCAVADAYTTVLVRQEPTSTTAAPTPTSPTTTTDPTTTTAPTTTTTSVTSDLTVEGNGFVLVEGADIPDSLAAGAAMGEQGLVFLEQDTVVLTDTLDVSLAGSALRLSGESASAAIDEGTAICSYLYHFDPGERATTRVVMQFPGEVLGHTTNADSLARSTEFAADGVDYAWSPNAGVLVHDYISVDGQTVTFDFTVQNDKNNRDQVRIFTDCGS